MRNLVEQQLATQFQTQTRRLLAPHIVNVQALAGHIRNLVPAAAAFHAGPLGELVLEEWRKLRPALVALRESADALIAAIDGKPSE